MFQDRRQTLEALDFEFSIEVRISKPSWVPNEFIKRVMNYGVAVYCTRGTFRSSANLSSRTFPKSICDCSRPRNCTTTRTLQAPIQLERAKPKNRTIQKNDRDEVSGWILFASLLQRQNDYHRLVGHVNG